jgi:hypothetical protein
MDPNYRELLIAFCRSDPLCSDKPARDLTQEEARDLVAHFIAKSQLSIGRPLQFDEKSRRVSSPRAGERVFLQPPMIGGVSYIIVNSNTGLPFRMQPRVGALDLRFLVLLQRLAVMLKQDWGTTQIYHGGLGAGGGQCHKDGGAIDFYGAQTSSGQFMVKRDWGDAPVPTGGSASYRLAGGVNPAARMFFKDVWDFAEREARPGGFICHPDHPNPTLRKSHQNHLHFQIGTT